jgi:hypothetical protein
MRHLPLFAVLVGGVPAVALADDAPVVTADELAVARTNQVDCDTLASLDDLEGSPTLTRRVVGACRRDRWKLAVVVCFLRNDGSDCPRLMTRKQRARYRKIDFLDYDVVYEQRASAIERARKAGILGGTQLRQGGGFASITAVDPFDTASVIVDQVEVLTGDAEPETHDADWLKRTYLSCTEQRTPLVVTVTFTDGKCSAVKVVSKGHPRSVVRCLREFCSNGPLPGVVPDGTIRARISPRQ